MEIQRIRLIRFTLPGENSIHKNNDADEKLQEVSGRCLILSSDHYVFNFMYISSEFKYQLSFN